ncbi:hypothetical protein GCM10010954_10850 [Halobacillus andaensis]|uniref:DUF4181 domain-containing protein n=1 Tax=Halobacillus andaensis TaxID=1176239 RepID=A0A917B165_HALAA|nr:DUF4181 domain-containing protein [Halobacillus andaensis]MBP2003877.1 hypothetical protein [Halobacillus andaensis]GGF13933.1 hypothetical protein GCM10010954_10850 [Halobacillus andaensis]
MEQHGLGAEFWLEFFVMMGAAVFLIEGMPNILRRRMGADQKKLIFPEHVNDFHKRGDWILGISFAVILLSSMAFIQPNSLFFLLASLLFPTFQLIFQLYVEWRFSENRTNYKITIVQIGLVFVSAIGILLWLEPYIG